MNDKGLNKSYNSEIMINKSQESSKSFVIIMTNCLLQAQSFGISRKNIVLNQHQSSYDSEIDRINLKIPFAHKDLFWSILFDLKNPESGPDFEFCDKTFLFDPDLEDLEINVPSLVEWNFADPNCLLRVLTEMVSYYKHHQINKLTHDDDKGQIKNEYFNLIKEKEVCTEDVELIVSSEMGVQEVNFLIRLAVDFSKLPGRFQTPGADYVILQISYEGIRKTTELFYSVNLEDIFGNSFTLPTFYNSYSLVKYVQEVKKALGKKVNSFVENFELKKRYIASAVYLQKTSLIEYDSYDFSYVIFLFTDKDFSFLLRINLSPEFPTAHPTIILESIYLVLKGENYRKQAMNCPYSPRWGPNKMFKTALNHIFEKELSEFKSKHITHRGRI